MIDYHPGKANMVADALSRKGKMVVDDSRNKEHESLIELKKMGLRLSMGPEGSILVQVKIRSMLRDKVLEAQLADKGVGKIKEQINRGIEIPFQILSEGLVAMGKQIYLPKNKLLKEEILNEAYESRFTTHLGSTKMYRDLKEYYWWLNIKREIAEYVSRCGIC